MPTAAPSIGERAPVRWQGALMTIKAGAGDTGGLFGLVEASFPAAFGPPLHVHRREDEAFYVLEGEIRFRRGDEETVAGPGGLVLGPRGIPHAFKTGPEGARVLILMTPGGFEGMFAEAGEPVLEGDAAQAREPDAEAHARAAEDVAARYGFEVVGPPLD